MSQVNTENNSKNDNVRECPECGFTTIKGMPGGRDATCGNCGYKDPCCYDY
jgi:ribosomal protein S27AE